MQKRSSGSVKVFSPRFSREELIALLRTRLPALTAVMPVERVVLFGSWAQGKATAFSDIDLLIVYADPPRADAYKVVRRVLGVRGLEPHVYSQHEAEQVKATVERMARNGIVLMG